MDTKGKCAAVIGREAISVWGRRLLHRCAPRNDNPERRLLLSHVSGRDCCDLIGIQDKEGEKNKKQFEMEVKKPWLWGNREVLSPDVGIQEGETKQKQSQNKPKIKREKRKGGLVERQVWVSWWHAKRYEG